MGHRRNHVPDIDWGRFRCPWSRIAGALACGIGIIFVLPVIYAANIAAYKKVFPSEEVQSDSEPPRPEAYGGTYGTPQ